MEKYRGIVREIYEYEVEIEAEDSGFAITKLKKVYEDDSVEGVFVAEASTYLRAEFSLRK
jgi:hypothetical protein